jgi:hypothetical protein
LLVYNEIEATRKLALPKLLQCSKNVAKKFLLKGEACQKKNLLHFTNAKETRKNQSIMYASEGLMVPTGPDNLQAKQVRPLQKAGLIIISSKMADRKPAGVLRSACITG